MADDGVEAAAIETPAASVTYTLWQMTAYALRLGTLGFGGPVALVGYMHRDLVERRGWISEAEYKEGLTLAQLMPGPLAAQLAIYLGYVHYGVVGASLVGVSFVLPSFLMVVALGWAYAAYGGLPWMQAVFYGVGASVIGIITISAFKLTSKTIGADRLLWCIYAVSAGVTIGTEQEYVLMFLGAGLISWFVRMRPRSPVGQATVLSSVFPAALCSNLVGWAVPDNLASVGGHSPPHGPLTTDWPTLGRIAVFFTKAGAFVFGSGLAIVPFLRSGVVHEYGWMNDQQFLDAVAVAMITPGPVVITVGFIGYHVQGLAGAIVAALGTFLPCYLFTIVPAPYFKKHGKRPGIVAFVDGVTAAAIGAIAGAVVVLGRRTLVNSDGVIEIPKLVILVVTVLLLWRFKKLPEPVIVLAAAVAGLAIAQGS
jgi:chromate transporter